ncbi:N-acetylmuramoyl-L-alanine amidase [Alkalihalobacillus oceani]|uniref:N-acetylmuramoyl-L-alanine amidase n=1 Tax=Halalkalibacter oceani TaxID=1653776 RepID=A0A9X2DSZ5_9BACI|nr:N-acetylmuramoyl-L-alanine amidase [Halalkalibacter oceani]MCM3716146.1 N-acetylmuramoyl-L-alanine amidase [Halalkalibacter oceani]
MSGKRIFIAVFIIACTLFLGATYAAAASEGTVTSGSTLNVRAEPSTTSERIGSLQPGATVTIIRTSGDWHQIQLQGRNGYVHKDYITVKSSASANDISIYVNNQKLEPTISKVPMENNHVLVPFRVIGEALGIDVKWQQQIKQVTAREGGTEVILTVNKEEAKVNGQTLQVSPAPKIIENSTVIPLRFFAEAFGKDVSWNQATKEVRVNSSTAAPPVQQPPETDVKGAYSGQVSRADSLQVRTGPGTQYESIGQLSKGARVEVSGFSDRWAKISFNGREAYVHSYYLDLYAGNQQQKMLGQPTISEVSNTTTVTWPKIGGTVASSHSQSGNKVTIQTDAVEVEQLTRAVKGVADFAISNQSNGKTITFTVSDGYQAAVSHTTGELIINVTPKVAGKPLSGKKIVIDPGHGGSDPGATANGLQEKELVLDVGLRTEKLLREAGANVIMTRDADVYPSLSDRVKVAHDVNAEVFISIHANAAGSEAAKGTETYWYATYSAANSEKLANSIHKRLIAHLGTTDRGVKQGNFQVIRETRMPSVLLELGFITNPSEAELLKKDSFRQSSAQAIYEGLLDYYK